MPAAIPFVVAAAAIAGTATSVVAANNAKSAADDQAKSQKDAQDKLIQDKKDQDTKVAGDAAANQTRDMQLGKQRADAAGTLGRPGTILTGPGAAPQSTTGAPIGSAVPTSGAGKTLLGS